MHVWLGEATEAPCSVVISVSRVVVGGRVEEDGSQSLLVSLCLPRDSWLDKCVELPPRPNIVPRNVMMIHWFIDGREGGVVCVWGGGRRVGVCVCV